MNPTDLARRPARALAIAFAALLCAGPSLAEEPPAPPPPAPNAPPAPPAEPAKPATEDPATPSNNITFTTPKDGMSLLDLLDAVNKQANRSIVLESKVRDKIKKETVQFVGSYTIPRSRLFDWLQGVLSFSSYILIPIGPTDHEQWMVVEMMNQAIRSRPTYVREEDLEAWKDRDGVYIVCTLRAKSLDANDAQRARTAIQQLMSTTNNLGRINEVPGQNAFIIADFAPVVYAARKLLEAMDQPLKEKKQVLVKVQIHYAIAGELADVLTDLLSGVTATGQPRRPVNPQQPDIKPEPQIIADDRTNSLILFAVPEDIESIKTLIEQLDTEFRGKSKIHFRLLKYQSAEDVQAILEDLISGTAGSGSSRPGLSRSSRSSRSRTTTQPGQPQAPFAGAPTEGEPVIIADGKNNSLIVHATTDQYAELAGLIDQLDRPRKQVLIETALMELTVGDTLDVGVDLFGVPDNIAVDTDGDGVVDTFTDAAKWFSTSFFNNSAIATTEIGGVDVPIGASPVVGPGLTAGVFKNGKLPFILSALQSRSPAKILTMPSIVTSDNQPATIKTTDSVPYQTTVFVGPNSTPQTSFEDVEVETSLTISPSISADDFLRLNVKQQVSSVRAAPAGQRPPTTSRDIETELMIPNASTVVLGGIVSSQETESLRGIPILMDIPILGFLFRDTSKTMAKTNLFLFVTPTIMKDLQGFSDYHRVTWEKKLQQDKLFGEEVELLGARFLGPDVADTAQEAVLRIDGSGMLDAYRYGTEASESERIDATRRAWERMQKEKREAEERAGGKTPPPGEPVPPPKPPETPPPERPAPERPAPEDPAPDRPR